MVRADCGGTFAGGTGSQLYGWNWGESAGGLARIGAGGWLQLGPAAANAVAVGASQPYLPAPPAARLTFSAADEAEARRYLVEGPAVAAFQCRQAGAAGMGTGGVAMDYVEVRVRYECLKQGEPCVELSDCCSEVCTDGRCGP
ncbi:MAG TPA: hypothetical protein VGK67_19665 [Myxococcales bacterium]